MAKNSERILVVVLIFIIKTKRTPFVDVPELNSQ